MRRVHGYSRTARVDLRPSREARLRLERSNGKPLFDFRITTGPWAFRVEESALQPPSPRSRFLHAIGDSYTMGWGVDAAASYPAQLARSLEPELRVLNLAVDGFGAIGATGKSRELAGRFPPVGAVYLFSPNDLDDDLRAAAVAARGDLAHIAHEALDAVRSASYVAGIPFALRYRLRFRAGPEIPVAGTTDIDPRSLLIPAPAALPAPPEDHPTFVALRLYRDFLGARGARLSVLVLSTEPESLMAYRFCREQGIEAHLFDVPPALRLPDEGHFNAEGNKAVAALVMSLLRESGDGAER
jgi:hypothetical protein